MSINKGVNKALLKEPYPHLFLSNIKDLLGDLDFFTVDVSFYTYL